MKHAFWIMSLAFYTGIAFGELADVPTSEIDQAPPLPLVQAPEHDQSAASSALVADVARSALSEINAKTPRSADDPPDLSTVTAFCRERGC